MEISLFEVFCSLISQFNFSIDCPAVPDFAKFWCRKISLQVEFIVNNLMMTFRMKYGCLPSSLHEEDVSRICVSSLITCYSRNWDVIFSISDPSKLVASLQNQLFHFALKSPIIASRKGLFSA